MEFDPMKLPGRKIAAAGGLVCAATIGIIELRRWTEPTPSIAEQSTPVVTLETPSAAWQSTMELDDETAGIDPDALLPAKLQIAGRAAELEFASALVPETKADDNELKNPSREELLLHIARNARKRKDYDESAKFYRRTLDLQKGRADVHYEFAEMLAEAGKSGDLKVQLATIEKQLPPANDADRKRLEDLKNRGGEANASRPSTLPTSPTPVAPATEKKSANEKGSEKGAKSKSLVDPGSATAKKASKAPEPARPAAAKKDAKPGNSLDPPMMPSASAVAVGRAENVGGEVADAAQPFQPPTLEDYARAIAANPDDAMAKLGLSRLYLKNWRCGEAGDLLADASPRLKDDREYRLTIAWRHAILGEYQDAKFLLQRLLDEQPGDACSMLALADLYFLAKDYQRALGEYGKICEGLPESSDALLGAAQALMELHRYDDAFLVLNRRLAADPGNPEAFILLTETLRRCGKLEEALARNRKTIASMAEGHPTAPAIRLQLAKLLLHKGLTVDARHEFERLAPSEYGNHPIVVWGLWAFPAKGDDKKRPPHPPVPPEDVNFAVTVSDFFIELGQYADAVSLLEQASAASPSEILLLNRLGDARSRLRTGTGRYSAMDSYMRALTLSPNNSHALLGYAKAARHAGLLPESLEASDRLIALDANDVPARLEKARALYAMGRFSDADAVYAQAARTPVEEQLRRELGRLAENLPPDKQQALMPALTADPNHLREVMTMVAQQNESLREDLLRLAADYDAGRTMRGEFAAERKVKAYSDWSPIRGIDAGMKRLTDHPLDDEAAFDLGRNYSRLGSTREAERYYRRVLAHSPNHRVAAVAAERLFHEHGPRATLDGDYFRQRGRNGLTDVDRYRMQTWGAVNIGDEDEFIAAGYGRLHCTLRDAPDVDGDVASVRVQFKPFDLLVVHAQVNGESYDGGFNDRLTYDVGAAWRASDCLRVSATLFGNNVAENAESIRQDVHRDGASLGVDYTLNRCDDVGGYYRWADYSDDNRLNEFGLYASRRLSLWPDELKWIGDVRYWSYDEGTSIPIGTPFGAPPLFGTVHPYFAPSGYAIFSSHLEWNKALGGDAFKEADLCWVGLRGGAGVDTDGELFGFARATFHRDVCYWLSFHTELGFTESNVYRDVSAYAYLTARLRKYAKG
jgi:tetratricopeptide (TPR) repeat protein